RRTRERQQTFHVLHMFLYNHFPKRKGLPMFCRDDGKTIDWAHFSDPTIEWALIDKSKFDFLRTRDGRPASLIRDGTGKLKWLVEPDEDASLLAIDAYQTGQRVYDHMAAPGVARCGEPCLCGMPGSNHLTGKAADLIGLDVLARKIR